MSCTWGYQLLTSTNAKGVVQTFCCCAQKNVLDAFCPSCLPSINANQQKVQMPNAHHTHKHHLHACLFVPMPMTTPGWLTGKQICLGLKPCALCEQTLHWSSVWQVSFETQFWDLHIVQLISPLILMLFYHCTQFSPMSAGVATLSIELRAKKAANKCSSVQASVRLPQTSSTQEECKQGNISQKNIFSCLLEILNCVFALWGRVLWTWRYEKKLVLLFSQNHCTRVKYYKIEEKLKDFLWIFYW